VNKTMIVVISVFLVIAGISAQACARENSAQQWLNGSYRLSIKAGDYRPYSTDVTITSLDEKTIKISGDFDGLPVTAQGSIQADKSALPAIAVYQFKVNNEVFNGQAVLTFNQQNGLCRITGSGSGAYHYLGTSGISSAFVTGVKETNRRSHVTWAVLVGVLMAMVLVVISGFYFRRLDA
jgi:hypothetical protein